MSPLCNTSLKYLLKMLNSQTLHLTIKLGNICRDSSGERQTMLDFVITKEKEKV